MRCRETSPEDLDKLARYEKERMRLVEAEE